jgi:hypothetical protein
MGVCGIYIHVSASDIVHPLQALSGPGGLAVPIFFVNEISSPPLTLTLLIILYCNIVPPSIVSNLMMA